MYLPAAAQDLLFNRIQDLAAPGSRLGVEGLEPEFADPESARCGVSGWIGSAS